MGSELMNCKMKEPLTFNWASTPSSSSSIVINPKIGLTRLSILPCPVQAPSLHGCTIWVECYYLKSTPSYRRREACPKGVHVAQPDARVVTTKRLKALRQVMKNQTAIDAFAVDAYIITSDDEHQTEFVSEHDKRREYISGFSGGRGDAIVTQNKSALWVEGGYHLQADQQIDCSWLLMREGRSDVPTRTEWLKKELPQGSRVAADPKLISEWLWQSLETELNKANLTLVPLQKNLIDLIWKVGRPNQRNSSVFILDDKYSGKNYIEKVKETREEVKKLGADAMVVTALDEIAWLLNIRARDIPYHPYVRSYLLLDMLNIRLYVNSSQLFAHDIVNVFRARLGVSRESVIFNEYGDIWTHLTTLTQTWNKVLIPSKCSYSLGASHHVYQHVKKEKQLPHVSPIIHLKAVKNQAETRGMLDAHVRDAAALCIFFEYFETRFHEGDVITELDVVEVLGQIRYEQEICTGNSFRTIAGFGPHGAMPHYEPSPSTNAVILNSSTLVLDSGGQYRTGTTDVTRTVHLGTPTHAEKRAYTLVLMAHIELSSLVFPSTLRGNAIDTVARAQVWQAGFDYLHETSHGVGSYLGARESPININYRDLKSTEVLRPGYFISSEPGLYREEFGVRLENVLRVIERPDISTDTEIYLAFEDVTLVPYQYKLIDFSLLTKNHRRWLDHYNGRIRVYVGDELKSQNKMKAFYWMMENTGVLPADGNRISFSLVIFFCSFILSFCIL